MKAPFYSSNYALALIFLFQGLAIDSVMAQNIEWFRQFGTADDSRLGFLRRRRQLQGLRAIDHGQRSGQQHRDHHATLSQLGDCTTVRLLHSGGSTAHNALHSRNVRLR